MASKHRSRRRDRVSFSGLWVLLFVPIYLLLPGFKGFSGISEFKTWLYYGLTGLLLVGTLAVLLTRVGQKRGGTSRLIAQPISGVQIAALCYLGFTLLSAAFSPYQPDAWYSVKSHEAAITICLYVLMYLFLARTDSLDRRFARVLCGALLIFGLISAIQLFGGNPLGLYPSGYTYADGYGVKYAGAFLGTMGNVDLVSVFLCSVIPIFGILAWRSKGALRWWSLGTGVLLLGILLWIRVLCGIVGLALGLVIGGFVVIPWSKRGRMIYAAVVIGGGICAALVLRLWDPPLNFLHEIHEILNGRISDRFGSGRIYIWRQMLERVPDRLLLGNGPDTVRLTALEPFRRYDETGKLVAQATLTDAHCFPLQILYSQGLPALLSWLAMVGLALRRWWRNRTDPAAAAFGLAVVCWICGMLFGFSSVILQPWFWLFLGLLESRTRTLSAGEN